MLRPYNVILMPLQPNNLHFFNPDHDLALAHGRTHYVPPASAVAFAVDAAPIVAWLTRDAAVLVPNLPLPDEFLRHLQELRKECRWVTRHELPELPLEKVVPWGWNYNIWERLKKWGVAETALPSDAEIAEIQRLSHRHTAAAAMQFLRDRVSRPERLPLPAHELHTLDEADQFFRNHADVMFKMPWSGSGRGLRHVVGTMSTHQRGWIGQSIRKHGCTMAEPYHSVVQDFAMEFICGDDVRFEGYSLFETHNGVYLSNTLMSDEAIEKHLSQWIDTQILAEYKSLLIQFLKGEIAPYYNGCVGVDMFVYQKDGNFFVNPAVELNLRMTMGLLANRFVREYMAPGTIGKMSVEYRAGKDELFCEQQALQKKFPPVFADGKLISGCIVLSPVMPETCYTVRVTCFC